jgi:fumarylacetoacetase
MALGNTASGGLDIRVSASLRSARMIEQGVAAQLVSHGNADLLYWTLAQTLTHHASGGCDMRPGDLIGTGTLSSTDPRHSGCLLEITSNGRDTLTLPTGEQSTFLEDGDEVTLAAVCERSGFRSIGFGLCSGTVLPARHLTR